MIAWNQSFVNTASSEKDLQNAARDGKIETEKREKGKFGGSQSETSGTQRSGQYAAAISRRVYHEG